MCSSLSLFSAHISERSISFSLSSSSCITIVSSNKLIILTFFYLYVINIKANYTVTYAKLEFHVGHLSTEFRSQLDNK